MTIPSSEYDAERDGGMKLEVKRNTWCKHRTPFTDEHKTCKVDVDFHQFENKPRNHLDIKMMPCLGGSAEAISRCDKYEVWTDEELAAQEAAHEARWERMKIIRKVIVEMVESTGVRAGAMPCPACKSGTVRYTQAVCKDHVHAACSTKGCASWME